MKKIFLGLILLMLSIASYSQNLQYVYHEKDTIALPELSVYGSLRATNTTPFSFSNVTKAYLDAVPAAEAAYALSNSSPSITFYSDNGSNYGYVYYRLRGIDQTRLNVTLNGVPLNEPEDQGSYFNNFPNFLSVISDVQIVRGAGLSKSGTSTFGGSLNFETKHDYGRGPLVDASMSYGSYGTKIFSGSVNANKFFVGASKYSTDGYKYHSDNDSWSLNYGSDFKLFGQKTKLFGIIGKQENGMAWVGETLEDIYKNDRVNSNKVGERDNFLNIHNQLSFENTSIRKNKITYSLFHQYQDGWYDTDISLFDPSLSEGQLMSRIKLNFNWLGTVYNQTYTNNNLRLHFGGSYNVQRRNHEGLSNFENSGFASDYTNIGVKQELTQYIKAEIKVLKKWTVYGDLQNRYVNFKYKSPSYDCVLYDGGNLNYGAGVVYKDGNHFVHYGFGKNSREPRRSDLFGGADNYAGSLNKLEDESVNTKDVGYKYSSERYQLSVNAYIMEFTNEFMPTGEYGENSIALYKNVSESYRKGIEVSAKVRNRHVDFYGNLTLSKNMFLDSENKWKTSILSPSSVANIGFVYNPKKKWYAGSTLRYNGECYIDLSNDFSLPSYTVLDAYVGYSLDIFDLRLNVNNLANSFILSNGMIGFDGSPRYFVMQGFNSLLTLKISI